MSESVYISSTYSDLKIFREAVLKCIYALGDYYKPVSMEFYNAEDVHFVKKCLSDVEACNIYILILGKRYGYVPNGFNKSITELEYEKARDSQRNGGNVKEILIFKIGELCTTYAYKEADPKFIQYQESFLREVNEQLSPKPFDSEAELALQVSHSLMKRLFRLIRKGEKIIPPDKEAILCYCDRNIQINSLKNNVLINKKRLFFAHGNRIKDFPGGIVQRFARYSLGSINTISDPFIQITDLFSSTDADMDESMAFNCILDYLGLSLRGDFTLDSLAPVQTEEFIKQLSLIRSTKIIIPFFYNFLYTEDSEKFDRFLKVIDQVLKEHEKNDHGFQLFFIVLICCQQPDVTAIKKSGGKLSHHKIDGCIS